MKKTKKKSRKPKGPPVARITIILENTMGIKRQVWVSTPKDFKISWPIDVTPLLGERMIHAVCEPRDITMEVTMSHLGSVYRCNHEDAEWEQERLNDFTND